MISFISGLAALLLALSFLPTAFGQFKFTFVPNFVGPCEPLSVQWQNGQPPFQAAVRVPDISNGFTVERRFNTSDRSLQLNLDDEELQADQIDVVVFDANNDSIGTQGDTLLVVASDCGSSTSSGATSTGSADVPNNVNPSDAPGIPSLPPNTTSIETSVSDSTSEAPLGTTTSTPGTSSANSTEPTKPTGISVGAIAAIAIGAAAIALLLAVLAFVCWRRRARRQDAIFRNEDAIPVAFTGSFSTEENSIGSSKAESATTAPRRATLHLDTTVHSSGQPGLPSSYPSSYPLTSPSYLYAPSSYSQDTILPLYTRPYSPRTTSLVNSPFAVAMAHSPFSSQPQDSALQPLRSADAESFFSNSETPHIDSVTEATRQRLQEIQRKLAHFETEIDAELGAVKSESHADMSSSKLADIERRANSLINEKGRITGAIPPPAYGPQNSE